MRLTRGEAWWLLRRRLGRTQAEFAAECRVSVDRLRDWERGRAPAPSPTGAHPWPRLSYGEYCAIARRRLGWTIALASAYWHISRQTLVKIEADRTSGAYPLARQWAVAYPEPRGPAPIRIGSPSR